MNSTILKLSVISALILGFLIAGSYMLQAAVTKTVQDTSTVDVTNVEEVQLPSVVQSSKAYLEEKVQQGDAQVQNVDVSSEPMKNAHAAYLYYRELMLLPVPFEQVKKEGMILDDTVYYRASSSDELDSYDEEIVYSTQRARTDLYSIALNNLLFLQPVTEEDSKTVQYLENLAEEFDFYVPPITYGNACGGADTLGCYFNSNEIQVTPLALQIDEGDGCLILGVIAHETRHYQQMKDKPVKDYVLPELEDDANAFMRESTPSRCKAPVYGSSSID